MEPWCDLWIYDEPMAYQPAKGPRISLKITHWSNKMAYYTGPWPWNNDNTMFSLGWNWNCSWISYVVPGIVDPQASTDDSAILYPPDGGIREYTNLDGTVPEFSTNTRMIMETNADGYPTGYRVVFPSGAQDVYAQSWPGGSGNANYPFFFRTQQIDPSGNATTFVYTNNADGGIFLACVVDGDGQTNFLGYTNVGGIYECYNLISQVTDAHHHSVHFAYDGNADTFSGCLTNVTDVDNISSDFGYDFINDTTFGVSSLTTPYGVTSFDYLPPYDGDTAGNAIVVTEANGSHQMFAYFADQKPTSLVATIPSTYTDPRYVPTNRPPDNSSGGNTLDNPDWNNPGTNGTYGDYMQQANSFYWGRQQFADLSARFLNTTPDWDLGQLTTNDFLVCRMRHWNLTPAYTLENNLSMEREPSPDLGFTMGEMTWYDYPGKPDYNFQGTSDTPILTIKVLPDGSDWYTLNELDQWNNKTNVISTYSVNGVTLTRTNRYVYAANGQDLLKAIGPDGITNAAYAYDSNHQVLFMTNALGEVTGYTYNANEQLQTILQPDGLLTTNLYGTDGYLAEQIQVGFSTNSYTYTNGLVYSHTDERGLSLTNVWDALNRLVQTVYPDGSSISYTFSNLDMVRVVDRMGFTNSFGYNSIRQKIAETNALGRVTHYEYCDCGALSEIIDALGNTTDFSHDNQGNTVQIAYPDGYAIYNTYNLLHQLVMTTDSSGMNVTNLYDNQGLLVVSSNNVGRVKSVTYNANDLATNVVDLNNVSVNQAYDRLHRILSRAYPDGGTEYFSYDPNISGPTSHTNQVGDTVLYGYDAVGRKTNEVFVGVSTNKFAYNAAGDLVTLTDGNNNDTKWGYDSFGRVTNKLDNLGNTNFIYQYDADSRLTNRWSGAKGNTVYAYDAVGNLTGVTYPVSPSIAMEYDALNRLTNMVDGVGTTVYAYDAAGQLLSEGGLWPNDTVSYAYANHLRTGLMVGAPKSPAWRQTYGYDSARRLARVTSPAGEFVYGYEPQQLGRVQTIDLPNGAVITNSYDSVARQTLAELMNSFGTDLDSYSYGYNLAGERTNVLRTAGDHVSYAYDGMGELKSAFGKESDGANRWQEQMGYAYDAAGNLNFRTNNTLLQNFQVNSLNEFTAATNGGSLTVAGTTTSSATNVTVNASNAVLYADVTFASTNQPWVSGNNTYSAIAKDAYGRKGTNIVNVNLETNIEYTYDFNGNLLSDGARSFAYDDENELISVWQTNAWRDDLIYDGGLRRRIEKDYTWAGGVWSETNEVHFIYDGNLVIQERWSNNVPLATYTRGNDLRGGLQSAGGTGSLLARTENGQMYIGSVSAHSFYHTDCGGNITMLVNLKQSPVARYLYDSYGNMLNECGILAEANRYRFSSKEWNANSGLYYYLYRFYDPNMQRWLNRDPIGESGFWVLRFRSAGLLGHISLLNGIESSDLYEFVKNMPVNGFDALGLAPSTGPGSLACAHATEQAEAALAMLLEEPSEANQVKYDELNAAQEAACKPPPPPPVPELGPCPTTPWSPMSPIIPQNPPKSCQWLTVGAILYWSCSEGSRLFPPRNLIPVP